MLPLSLQHQIWRQIKTAWTVHHLQIFQKMTLQEKRLIANIEANELPKFKTHLKDILGYEPVVEINWDSLTGSDEFPFTRLTGVVFRDLVFGFKEIAKDKIGQEAIKEAVERIKIESTADANSTHYALENKELYLKVQLAGSVMKSPNASQFRDWLEKLL
jgi:hypothetical protein